MHASAVVTVTDRRPHRRRQNVSKVPKTFRLARDCVEYIKHVKRTQRRKMTATIEEALRFERGLDAGLNDDERAGLQALAAELGGLCLRENLGAVLVEALRRGRGQWDPRRKK